MSNCFTWLQFQKRFISRGCFNHFVESHILQPKIAQGESKLRILIEGSAQEFDGLLTIAFVRGIRCLGVKIDRWLRNAHKSRIVF